MSFAGVHGVLAPADLPAFGAKISGFHLSGQKIDLLGFAFNGAGETVSWTQSGTSGTLTVSDGCKVASLTLIGTYATSNFHLATDGHGGTYVSDPPGAAVFGQTLAGFAPNRAATAAPVAGGAASIPTPLFAAAMSATG